MVTKANVLVTAAGTIVAQGIIKSLKLANKKKQSLVSYRIVTTDMNAQAAGLYRGELGIIVPSAASPDYIDHIIKICKEEKISAIFVGSDEEILPLAQSKELIKNETGATVITNPIDVISISNDKWKTFEFLHKNNLSCASSALPEDRERFISEFGFPLIVKPREGHGSLHVYVTNSQNELDKAILSIQKTGWRPLLQEYLKGDDTEFTSGVTIDTKGQHVMSSISIRKTIKHGQTYKAFVDDFKEVRQCAEEVAIKIGCSGPINIQAKLVGEELKIFEINPRFSATCPIRAVAGVNEPDIIFRNTILGENIKINKYRRLVCMRYWNEVYIPYSTYEKTTGSGKTTNDESFLVDYF